MNDVSTLLLALPIFGVLYGLLSMWSAPRRKSPQFRRTSQSDGAEKWNDFLHATGDLSINSFILSKSGLKPRLDQILLRAGQPYGWKAADFLVIKEISMLCAVVLLWGLDYFSPLAGACAAIIGFLLPDLLLMSLGNTRKSLLQRQLPTYVDLLSLSLESGMDLLIATERIHEKMKPGPFRSELAAMLQEYRLGTARKDVLKHWAARADLPDVVSLASLIIQSDEIGGDLPTVLRSYAEDMRNRRVLFAEEVAAKVPVKILFPLVVFFLPIVFVIILGPISMEFMKTWH